MQVFDYWNSIAIALMMLWMFMVCVSRVSIEASMHISVLRLMLLVSVVSLSSIVSVSSLMALVKSFSETNGEDAVMLFMGWAFWAMTSHIVVYIFHKFVDGGFGGVEVFLSFFIDCLCMAPHSPAVIVIGGLISHPYCFRVSMSGSYFCVYFQ